MINLDYASHTPIDEAVLAEFCRIERECGGNALSAHGLGREAMAELERATQAMAEWIGVCPEEIIYTSGASEANNLAIKGIARTYAYKGKHILSTCLEHPSVSGTLAFLQDEGFEIELLKILPNGKIDLAHLEEVIRADTILLCVSEVDSELGAIQPINEIEKLLEKYPNCRLHNDATQAMGKIPVYIGNASTLCFSPHKFYGLGGFGVLVKRNGVVLEPLIHGGGGYRSGTPSPAMAGACFKALEIAIKEQEARLEAVSKLRKYVLDGIKGNSGIRVNSPVDGSPYILNLSVKGVKGADFQAMLDKRGIAVSVKSACSTDKSPSRPVFAVSKSKKNALESWRVSFSHLTTTQELDLFLGALCI
jgi:cysteine desulfurase